MHTPSNWNDTQDRRGCVKRQRGSQDVARQAGEVRVEDGEREEDKLEA